MKKRSFSQEEKLQILMEAEKNGINITLEKYQINRASFFTWKKKFSQMGEQGLEHGMTPANLKRIEELEAENQRLRDWLASIKRDLQLKSEELRKMYESEK